MRSFPFEHCPPADDLLSYERGTADEKLQRRIEAHIATCGDCERARTSLKSELSTLDELVRNSSNEGFLSYVRRQAPESVERIQQRLAEQQDRMRRVLADPRPALAIGQIWAALHHEEQDGLSHLVLVLDEHVSAATGHQRVNLVPVTLDDSIASEWSLIFETNDSGVGFPVVIHADFERSAPIACLDRCIGRLPASAGSELLDVVRAWSRSGAPPSGLVVGRLGRPETRTRTEWQAFATWLATSMRAICDSPGSDTVEDEPDALLDGSTAPTGGATAPASPRPANPSPVRRPTVSHGLELVRPAALVPQSPEIDEDSARARRVAENRQVYGASPPSEADALAPSIGFLDAAREFLRAEHSDELALWCRKNQQSVNWEQLGLLRDTPIAHLDAEGWRSRVQSSIKDQPVPVRTSILVFVSELRSFRVKRAGSLAGATLGQQAARRQTPSSSRPPQK